jgi:sortase A
MGMTMKHSRNRRGIWLICLGGLLLCGALALTAYNLLSERAADRFATQTVKQLETIIPDRHSDAVSQIAAEPSATTVQSVGIDGATYIGILTIPALNLSLPVNSTWSYPLLRRAPCCYRGSVLTNDLIIAGHNYKKHFGNLKLLNIGDKVQFTDVDGYEYFYTVSDVETIAGNHVGEMTAGDWDLTLFTCTYGGVNRVVIRCKLAT